MTELALTRSRPKYPPAKVATERERIKSKVKKSETKKRRNVMDARQLRLAELDREIEDLRQDSADRRRERAEERNTRIAAEVDQRAQEIMQSEGINYSAAVRRAIAESDHFTTHDEPAQSAESVADAVARRMKATPHPCGQRSARLDRDRP